MPEIHPTAFVEPGAQLADDVVVGPMCHVGEHAVIGASTRLVSHAVVQGHTTIGQGNVIWPHSVIGGDPQDLDYQGEPTRLVIGDNNIIRESVTIHRGTIKGGSITTVGSNNYLMVGAHIAHDCKLGDRIIMANNVLLAGHIHIENNAVISGGVAIHHFTTIGCFAFVGGLSRVLHDVPPYMISDGRPSRVRCINRVGLNRGGFADAQINNLESAYKKIFRHGYTSSNGPLPITERLTRLLTEFPDDQHINHMVDNIRNAATGPHGRYLETFRKDRPG